jgi:hypothetical protein
MTRAERLGPDEWLDLRRRWPEGHGNPCHLAARLGRSKSPALRSGDRRDDGPAWQFRLSHQTVHWDPSSADHALPDSLYLSKEPDFFNAGSGYTWPWVDPVGNTKLYTLPAKARYDAGTPFLQL